MTPWPPDFRVPSKAAERRQYRAQMTAWLEEVLDREMQSALQAAATGRYVAVWKMLAHLKAHYPEIIPRLKEPDGRRRANQSMAQTAADFTRRIRAAWAKAYGPCRRTPDETAAGYTAEDFAIAILKDWCGDDEAAAALTPAKVQRAAHKGGKHKARRKRT
jgi:hypothetical protein